MSGVGKDYFLNLACDVRCKTMTPLTLFHICDLMSVLTPYKIKSNINHHMLHLFGLILCLELLPHTYIYGGYLWLLGVIVHLIKNTFSPCLLNYFSQVLWVGELCTVVLATDFCLFSNILELGGPYHVVLQVQINHDWSIQGNPAFSWRNHFLPYELRVHCIITQKELLIRTGGFTL